MPEVRAVTNTGAGRVPPEKDETSTIVKAHSIKYVVFYVKERSIGLSASRVRNCGPVLPSGATR